MQTTTFSEEHEANGGLHVDLVSRGVQFPASNSNSDPFVQASDSDPLVVQVRSSRLTVTVMELPQTVTVPLGVLVVGGIV